MMAPKKKLNGLKTSSSFNSTSSAASASAGTGTEAGTPAVPRADKPRPQKRNGKSTTTTTVIASSRKVAPNTSQATDAALASTSTNNDNDPTDKGTQPSLALTESVSSSSSSLLSRKDSNSSESIRATNPGKSITNRIKNKLANCTATTTSTKGPRRCFFRRTFRKRFSLKDSTEALNCINEAQYFGPYSHIRKQLDYSYHSHYQKERQWLQDSIIEEMLDDRVEDRTVCVTPTEPWMLYTTGVKGAGKKHVVNELVKSGRLPLLSFVSIDQDEIRRRLPEYGSYVQYDPRLVEKMTKKECGYIAEIILLAAFQAGRNVIIDGTMSDPDWEMRRIQKLRQQYSCLKLGLIHVTASYDTVVQRCKSHSKVTGRQISEESIQRKLEEIPQSVQKIRPILDSFFQIHNDDTIELVGDDATWPEFQLTFLQTCAWMPGMHGKPKLKREVSNEQKQDAVDTTTANHRRRRRSRRFSTLISSEENNRSDDQHYYGKFSHIRASLDYSYHANYVYGRQKLQDAIIEDMLESAIVMDKTHGKLGTVPTEPWIVFTAGAMGAGKSYTMNRLVEKGRFPLTAFVVVDPDEIRRLLPEYHVYVQANPELAGELTRKEAGFIAEILTLAALQAGKNVLQDGSLRDSEWYRTYFQRLRKDFPSLRQAILHITAPREAVFQRAADRALLTGRVVPEHVLEEAMKQVPRSVKILAPLVDYYAELNNAPNAPDIELVKPKEATWDTFRDVWKQTVAYVPSGKKLVEISKKLDKKSSKDSIDSRNSSPDMQQ